MLSDKVFLIDFNVSSDPSGHFWLRDGMRSSDQPRAALYSLAPRRGDIKDVIPTRVFCVTLRQDGMRGSDEPRAALYSLAPRRGDIKDVTHTLTSLVLPFDRTA